MSDTLAGLFVNLDGDGSGAEKAIKGVASELAALDKATDSVQKGIKKTEDAGKVAAKQAKVLSERYNALGEGIDKLTKPAQYLAVVTAAGAVAATKFAIDFEDSFAAVKKTVDGTPQQLEKIKKGIIDLSTVGIEGRKAIPKTTAELNELAAAGGQLGIHTENIVEFTEVMAQLGTATNLSGETGAQTIARFMNVANISQEQVKNLGSAIVDLGNNFATTEAEIADMALRLGATATEVGISAPDILAYSTALSSMGVEAEAGGSAVSRVLMGIHQAVSAGGGELSKFAKLSGKSASEFANAWKNDASAAFQDFLKGLNESEDSIGTLAELGFNNIRDIQALQKLAGEKGFEELTRAIEASNDAWEENIALQKEFDAKAETTASQLIVTKNNLVEAGRSIGEVFLPSIAEGTETIKNIAQSVAQMDEGQREHIITLGKSVIGFALLSKGAVGTLKGLGSLADTVSKLGKTGIISAGTVTKLTSVLAASGPAIAGVAAGAATLGITILAAKKGYDAWYDSHYRWARSLESGNKSIKEEITEMEKLQKVQSEFDNAKLVIENPKSNKEELDKAHSKIEEIRRLLEEEYQLKINTDTTNIDEILNKLQEKNIVELELETNTQLIDFRKLENKSKERQKEIISLKELKTAAENAAVTYSDLSVEYDTYYAKKEDGKADEYREGLISLARELGYTEEAIENANMDWTSFAISVKEKIDSGLTGATKDITDYSERISALEEQQKDFKETAETIALGSEVLLGRYSERGDAEAVTNTLEKMGEVVRKGGLGLNEYAQRAAEAMNGQGSLTKAFQEGGPILDAVVNDYIRASKEFGASTAQTATGATLLRNGLKSIGEAASQGKLEDVTQQANELAQSMGGMEGKRIEISAEGDISVIDEISGKIEEIQTADGTTVSINAEGNIEALTETGEIFTDLDGKAAYVSVNAETNNIEVFDETNTKIAEIDGQTGTVTLTTVDNTTEEANTATQAVENIPKDSETKITQTGAEDVALKAQNVADAVNNIPLNRHVSITASFDGFSAFPVAQGTSDFQGGLAMINDEKGVSDPRELVEVGGQGYIFEGRDVVLPLPEHAKVYTAGQTQKILSSMAIPRYASGKNNDAWANAKDELSHRQKTSYIPMSSAEMFKWIDEMKSRFANNIEAMQELDEMFVETAMDSWDEYIDNLKYQLDMGEISEKEYYEALENYRDEYIEKGSDKYKEVTLDIHKYNEEVKRDTIETANEVSKAWIENRAKINDWNELSDSMGAAYSRIMERNAAALNEGTITWEEYLETGNKTFESLLSGYIGYSDEWISQQKNYSAMSAQEEKAAIERQRAELDKLKADLGELTEEQWIIYLETSAKLDKNYMDASAREVEEWRSDADFYQQQSNVYGWDWLNAEDSAVKYWERRLEEEIKNSQNEELSANERNAALRKADEARMEIYQAREAELDEALDAFRTEIDETRETLNKKVSDLRASWTVEDRQEDMSDIAKQMSIYENAVTKEGRDKYKSLQEEYKNLQREEQVYQMETENNATLEELEAEYEQMEKENATTLKNLKADLTTANSQQYTVLTESLTQAKNVAGTATEMKESLDNGIFVLGNIHKSIIDLSEAVNGLKSLSNRPLNISAGAASNANWLSSTRYNYPY